MKRISRGSKNRPVVQFHWAAARNVLTPEQIEDLSHSPEHFHFDPTGEIGIESTARDLPRALETLAKLGFNRSAWHSDFHAIQEAVHRFSLRNDARPVSSPPRTGSIRINVI